MPDPKAGSPIAEPMKTVTRGSASAHARPAPAGHERNPLDVTKSSD